MIVIPITLYTHPIFNAFANSPPFRCHQIYALPTNNACAVSRAMLGYLNYQCVHTLATMENQHRKIKGYRELNEAEIALMNEIKEKAAEVGALCKKLEGVTDQRWAAIGKTDLQKGFMALTRSVAKPDFF